MPPTYDASWNLFAHLEFFPLFPSLPVWNSHSMTSLNYVLSLTCARRRSLRKLRVSLSMSLSFTRTALAWTNGKSPRARKLILWMILFSLLVVDVTKWQISFFVCWELVIPAHQISTSTHDTLDFTCLFLFFQSSAAKTSNENYENWISVCLIKSHLLRDKSSAMYKLILKKGNVAHVL